MTEQSRQNEAAERPVGISALLGAIETAKAYAVGDGPITIVTLRMDEALALVSSAEEAAAILREEAAALRECHTVSGEWDDTEPDAQAAYERMLNAAERLAPNGLLRRATPDGE